MILHLTMLCPKNAIVSDFSDDNTIPKLFAMFCNVNTPLCKSYSEAVIWA